MISWPCERSSAATAEESTPPDMATAIVLLGSADILLLFSQNWAGIAGGAGLDVSLRTGYSKTAVKALGSLCSPRKYKYRVIRFAQNDEQKQIPFGDDKQERQRQKQQLRLCGGYGFGFVSWGEIAQVSYGCRDQLDGLIDFFLGGEL